jgi:hypothetical protein
MQFHHRHEHAGEVIPMNPGQRSSADGGFLSLAMPGLLVSGGLLILVILLALTVVAPGLPAAHAGVLPTAVPPGQCRDGATYVADVTIPDNTVLQPGARFEKTWRLRNSGTCTWSSAYGLTYLGGSPLGALSGSAIPEIVPGAQADLTVAMVAPRQAGKYTSAWQMVGPSGTPFGDRVTAVIQVGSSGGPLVPAPGPVVTPTPVVQRQFTGRIVTWWPNCGTTYVKGRIVDRAGNPVNGLRVRVWADGWDGAFSRVSGVGDTYGPGEWDVMLRHGQTGKFYAQVWDWQNGSDSYVRVDSDTVIMEFNYTQANCQPESDGHQVAEVEFVRNR